MAFAAVRFLAALREREASGRGQEVNCSLFVSAIASMGIFTAYIMSALKLSVEVALLRRAPPRIGGHNSEILAELGYAPGAIAALRCEGIV